MSEGQGWQHAESQQLAHAKHSSGKMGGRAAKSYMHDGVPVPVRPAAERRITWIND